MPRTVKSCTFASSFAGFSGSPAPPGYSQAYPPLSARLFQRYKERVVKRGDHQRDGVFAIAFALTVALSATAETRVAVFSCSYSRCPVVVITAFCCHQHRQQNHHRFDDHLVIGGNPNKFNPLLRKPRINAPINVPQCDLFRPPDSYRPEPPQQ